MIINTFVIWLLVAFSFLIFEMGAPGLFFFLSFAIAAALTALASLFTDLIIPQCIIFIVGTALSFFILRVLSVKWTTQNHKTNTEALIGKKATVLQPVSENRGGLVKVNGEIWAAKSSHEIATNANVEVVKIEGCTLFVKEKA